MRCTLILTLILFVGQAWAQITSGRITYEETVQLDFELPPEMAMHAINLPKEKKSKVDLNFSGDRSVQKLHPEKDVEIPEDPDNEVEIRIQTGGQTDESVRYTNTNEGISLLSTRTMGKSFLIESEVEKINWKLKGEQKEILGFSCSKATAQVDSQQVVAWFAPAIPVSSGPMGIGGLPGLILDLSVDDGSVHFVALDFDKKTPSEEALKKPKKGKKVTREEYDALIRERMVEMGGRRSGGAMIIIETDED